jgi:hypothetical protein
MAEASIRVAKAQTAEEEAAIKRLYPEYINMQFGTANQLAANLNNAYLQRTRGVIGEELQAASAPSAIEAELQQRGLGDLRAGPTAIQRQLRDDAQRDLAAGPTAIESRLLSDAQRELALGRSLSAEEMRDASQSARAAFAARGLGTSLGSSAAEILNRDQYAQARESDRRNFAGAVNQQYLSNRLAIQDQAAQQAGLAGNLMGNASNVYGNSANVSFGGARTMVDIDPMARALGLAGSYSGANMQLGSGLISNAYQNAGSVMNQGFGNAANVASFNTNALDSRRNSYMNNQASLQAARMQSSALGQQGMMGMVGGIGGGALMGVGLAL